MQSIGFGSAERWTNQAPTAHAVAPSAWRGFSNNRMRWRNRCVCGTGTRWPPGKLVCTTPGSTGARRERRKARKNRRPGQGTSGVMLVVPPHFVAASLAATSSRTARRRAMRRLGNGSRFALPGARRHLLRHVASCLFGAELGGLFRRRSWSRFAATAVLLPVPAGYSSSS